MSQLSTTVIALVVIVALVLGRIIRAEASEDVVAREESRHAPAAAALDHRLVEIAVGSVYSLAQIRNAHALFVEYLGDSDIALQRLQASADARCLSLAVDATRHALARRKGACQ